MPLKEVSNKSTFCRSNSLQLNEQFSELLIYNFLTSVDEDTEDDEDKSEASDEKTDGEKLTGQSRV